MEEKCVKLIFALSRSAKVTWGFGHEMLIMFGRYGGKSTTPPFRAP